MITVQLTTRQFFYIQSAIQRDRDALEEMAPWDIDDQTEQHADDTRCSKEVGRILARVEQEQVTAH
jgi:chaperonin cofactor prefoldin